MPTATATTVRLLEQLTQYYRSSTGVCAARHLFDTNGNTADDNATDGDIMSDNEPVSDMCVSSIRDHIHAFAV